MTHRAAGCADCSCVEELPLRPCDLRLLWPLSQVEMGAWGRSSRISNPKPQRYSWAGARLNVCNTTVSCAGGVHLRVVFLTFNFDGKYSQIER
jgi:hypothetical protein